MTLYVETISPHPQYNNLHCHIAYGETGDEHFKAWGDCRAHADLCLAQMIGAYHKDCQIVYLPTLEAAK